MINKPTLSAPQVLDPRLLGRPVHLLPQFAAQLAEDLAVALRQPALRRYWDGFQLEGAAFVATPAGARSGRWLGYDCGPGMVTFAIERPLLLAVLNQRYGRRGAAPTPAAAPSTVRVTATEERLAVALGQQLATVLARRVDTNLARAHNETTPGPATVAVARTALTAAPSADGWTIGVTLRQSLGGDAGQLWLALDQDTVARVMLGLVPERARAQPRQHSVSLGTALQVKLDGRLVSKEITLEALFALKLGDVIPVTMGRAEVMLAESRLFTAAVTEHNGSLCLTSFEDTE